MTNDLPFFPAALISIFLGNIPVFILFYYSPPVRVSSTYLSHIPFILSNPSIDGVIGIQGIYWYLSFRHTSI